MIDTPAYRLRVSVWTRRLTLTVRPDGTLVVTAPRRVSQRRIAAFLTAEAEWIRATRARMLAAEAARPQPAWSAPREIALPAIPATWTVHCEPTATERVRLVETGPGHLWLCGAVGDSAACRRTLHAWLLRQGRAYLLPRLSALSAAHSLPFERGTIRLARTRWGSCSRQGVISLNAGLLLFQQPVVDYVLLHELCHTRHPNHSAAFWGLVAQHCPSYQEHRAELRREGRKLPHWVRA